MIRRDRDLFGEALPSQPAFRKDGRLRKVGYPAKPGTGPKGQRCSTCIQSARVVHRGTHTLKCERMSHAWTHGSETDVHPNAPACSEWSRRPWKARP